MVFGLGTGVNTQIKIDDPGWTRTNGQTCIPAFWSFTIALSCVEGGLLYQLSYRGKSGASGETRTRNLLIKSQLLYQLSYRCEIEDHLRRPVFLWGEAR